MGCAFASLLGIEFSKNYIPKRLDITRCKIPEKILSFPTPTPLFLLKILLEMKGYLRCDSRGMCILVPIVRRGTREKNNSISMEFHIFYYGRQRVIENEVKDDQLFLYTKIGMLGDDKV